MSAFDSTSFGEEHLVEQKTSGLAIGSLVCSLLCCTAIPGILLGFGALVSISGNPAKKGKGLAISGIVLGILLTAGQGIIVPYLYKNVYIPMAEAMDLVRRGPADAITAGFASDYDGYRSAFHGDGANTQDEEIRAFIDQLQSRYGGFVSSQMTDPQTQPAIGQTAIVFPYELTFENAAVDAEVEIIFAEPPQSSFINKLGYIKILDAELGDLEFPGTQVIDVDEDASDASGDTPGESAPNESDSGD